jgi:hypothetical protein
VYGDGVNENAPETEQGTAITALERRTGMDPEADRRREEVTRLRYSNRLSIASIVTELGKLEPPIVCTKSTVHRDLEQIRRTLRKTHNPKRFDALAVVGGYVNAFDEVAKKCMRLADDTKDNGEKAQFLRIYLDALAQQIEILQDADLINKRIGTLVLDDGKRRDRVPTGTELQRRFESVNVVDAELVSEAERAYLFGDAAAVDKAAEDAKGDQRSGGGTQGDTGDGNASGV